MCELISGWINIDTEEVAADNMNSHAKTQELRGWSSSDLKRWREWEWTGPGEQSLAVRTLVDDEHGSNWWRAVILARWPTWGDCFGALCRECCELDVAGRSNLTALPELPKCAELWCNGCTGLTALPELPECAELYCYGCAGLTALPELPECWRCSAGCRTCRSLSGQK